MPNTPHHDDRMREDVAASAPWERKWHPEAAQHLLDKFATFSPVDAVELRAMVQHLAKKCDEWSVSNLRTVNEMADLRSRYEAMSKVVDAADKLHDTIWVPAVSAERILGAARRYGDERRALADLDSLEVTE